MGHQWKRLGVAFMAAIVLSLGAQSVSQAQAAPESGSLADVRSQLTQLQDEQAKMSGDITALQSKLDLAQTQLNTTKDQIAAQQAEIDQLKPQLAQIALQEYQDRGMSSTAILFSSTDIDEVINYMVMSDQLASTTDTLLGNLQLKQAGLADLKTSQDATVASIQADQADLKQKSDELDDKVKQTNTLLKQLKSLAAAAAAASSSDDANSGYGESAATLTKDPSLGLVDPFPGALITRAFGVNGHTGLDMAKPCGTPIPSPANGVVRSYNWDGSLGNLMIVDNGVIDGKQVVTEYGHLSGAIAMPGDTVAQGQPIAKVGTTGYSTGCHLHFMVVLDGQVVNPAKYI